MELRSIVAEAGLDFDALQAAHKEGNLRNKLQTAEYITYSVILDYLLVQNDFIVF